MSILAAFISGFTAMASIVLFFTDVLTYKNADDWMWCLSFAAVSIGTLALALN